MLRKASVVVTVACALAAMEVAGGRLWAGEGDQPSLGPAVVVTKTPSSVPTRPPISPSVPPFRMPGSAATGHPSWEPTPPASSALVPESGGRPVATLPPPYSGDDDMPTVGGSSPGSDDGGDDGDEG